MKNVLIITYLFPPSGGPGVQRVAKFVKYLSTFNYNPIILTPNAKLIRYIKDFSLLKDLPINLKIYKTFILDINWVFKILYGIKLFRIVRFINGILIFPDYQRQWIPFAKNTIKKILKTESIDIVFSTSPPHSIHILTNWIKKKYNIPVVMDFRDPFTFNPLKKAANKRKNYSLESEFQKNSNFIIVNTPEARELCLKNFNVSPDKIEVLTNGYDKTDFVNTNILPSHNKKIIISHIGRLYGDYDASPLLDALYKVCDKIKNIEFRFIGGLTKQNKTKIKNNRLEKFIKIIDYCSHDKAIKYAKESDFLLLLQPSEEFTVFIPGKVFEYIGANKIILAIIPENGSCAELIRKTNTGVVISPINLDQIVENIISIEQNKVKPSIFKPNQAEVDKYDRRYLTMKLLKFLIKQSKIILKIRKLI